MTESQVICFVYQTIIKVHTPNPNILTWHDIRSIDQNKLVMNFSSCVGHLTCRNPNICTWMFYHAPMSPRIMKWLLAVLEVASVLPEHCNKIMNNNFVHMENIYWNTVASFRERQNFSSNLIFFFRIFPIRYLNYFFVVFMLIYKVV